MRILADSCPAGQLDGALFEINGYFFLFCSASSDASLDV